MKLSAHAPGKLILIGEYAVLEGAPSLVMAIERYAKISIHRNGQSGFEVNSLTLGLPQLPFELDAEGSILFPEHLSATEIEQLRFFRACFEYFSGRTGFRNQIEPFQIALDTSEFYMRESGRKLGLGSSAALTVALLKGLDVFTDSGMFPDDSPAALFKTAQHIHHSLQGKKGSGIDIASSCYGGTIRFQNDQATGKIDIQKMKLPLQLHLLPVWSGRSASTPRMVESVMRLKKEQPGIYDRLQKQMREISTAACDAAQANQCGSFLEAIDRYYMVMEELGHISGTDIISENHRRIGNLVKSSGAVYKPSGAGGGDIGFAATDSESIAQRVSDNILRSGLQLINLGEAQQGASVQFE